MRWQWRRKVDDLRCAQAVLLPAFLGATLEQTAAALGIGRATVGARSSAKALGAHPAQLDPSWGGRRRAAMSVEEEREISSGPGPGRGGRRHADRRAAARSVGPTTGATRGSFGRLSTAGASRLAQGGARHATPQERPADAGAVEKKLPEVLDTLLDPSDVGAEDPPDVPGRGRFGRMVRIRRCWAQKPMRPTVCNGYEREFLYVYGAVSPMQGQLDWMIAADEYRQDDGIPGSGQCPSARVHRHGGGRREFACRQGLGGAEEHRLLRLPPYAPELNPQEHVWDELREKEFPNRVFADMASVRAQLEAGLPRLASDRKALRSLDRLALDS